MLKRRTTQTNYKITIPWELYPAYKSIMPGFEIIHEGHWICIPYMNYRIRVRYLCSTYYFFIGMDRCTCNSIIMKIILHLFFNSRWPNNASPPRKIKKISLTIIMYLINWQQQLLYIINLLLFIFLLTTISSFYISYILKIYLSMIIIMNIK